MSPNRYILTDKNEKIVSFVCASVYSKSIKIWIYTKFRLMFTFQEKDKRIREG